MQNGYFGDKIAADWKEIPRNLIPYDIPGDEQQVEDWLGK